MTWVVTGLATVSASQETPPSWGRTRKTPIGALPIYLTSPNPPTPRVLSFRESRTLRYSQARLRYSQARLQYSQARLRYSQATFRYVQARLRYFPTLRRRHDETRRDTTSHMCLTKCSASRGTRSSEVFVWFIHGRYILY